MVNHCKVNYVHECPIFWTKEEKVVMLEKPTHSWRQHTKSTQRHWVPFMDLQTSPVIVHRPELFPEFSSITSWRWNSYMKIYLSFCRVTFYPLTHPSTSSSSTVRRRHLTRTTCIVILSSSLLNLLRGRPFHFRRTTHDPYLRCSQCEFCQRELFTAATPDCCGKFTTLAVFRRIGVRKREILDGHKVLRSVWVVW